MKRPESITVIPEKGRQVRTEDGGTVLPDDGMTVRNSTYWRRRFDAGDITIEIPKADEASKTGKSPAAKAAPDKAKGSDQ